MNRLPSLHTMFWVILPLALLVVVCLSGCGLGVQHGGTQRHEVHHSHDSQRVDVHIHRDGKTRHGRPDRRSR